MSTEALAIRYDFRRGAKAIRCSVNIKEVKYHVNVKLVPRDQGSSLLVVYCTLLFIQNISPNLIG